MQSKQYLFCGSEPNSRSVFKFFSSCFFRDEAITFSKRTQQTPAWPLHKIQSDWRFVVSRQTDLTLLSKNGRSTTTHSAISRTRTERNNVMRHLAKMRKQLSSDVDLNWTTPRKKKQRFINYIAKGSFLAENLYTIFLVTHIFMDKHRKILIWKLASFLQEY